MENMKPWHPEFRVLLANILYEKTTCHNEGKLAASSCHHVSISPIFYEQLFCTKIFCAAFMCLQFGFVIFGERILAQKLLIKCWWNWHQVAAWVSDMFCNFYLVKNYRIANNLAATGAREKISTYLESLKLKK
jgi:hypothetical protein